MNLNPMELNGPPVNYVQPAQNVTIRAPELRPGVKENPMDVEQESRYEQPGTSIAIASPGASPTRNANPLALVWPLPGAPPLTDVKSVAAGIRTGVAANPMDLEGTVVPYEQPDTEIAVPTPGAGARPNQNPLNIAPGWAGNYEQPFDFKPAAVPEAPLGLFASEVPVATDSGFRLSRPPNPRSSLSLYLNGLFETMDADYTLNANVGTWIVPGTAGALFAKYRY